MFWLGCKVEPRSLSLNSKSMQLDYGTHKVVRNRKGQFKNRGFVKGIVLAITVLVIGAIVWTGEVWVPAQNVWGKMKNQELKAVNTFIPVAEADEIKPGMSVEVLEAKLDEIVWGKESQSYVMQEGDIFETFDPADSEYQKCTKVGGRQPKYCLSRGPRQIKLSMVQTYWPKMHGKSLSDKEGRDVAEGNESSRRFFLDCAVTVGTKADPYKCANEWTTFKKNGVRGQIYIDLIREAKGVTIN